MTTDSEITVKMAQEFLSLPIGFEILMKRNDVRKQSRIHKTDI